MLSTVRPLLVELRLLNPCSFFGLSLMIDINSFVFEVGIIVLVTLICSFGTATRPWPGKSSYIRRYIQGVTGGTDQTSGECSLGQTIPI